MSVDRESRWELATKFVIVLSALSSVAFPAWYSALSHPYLPRALLLGLPLVYVAGRYTPETTAGLVVALGYAVPTLLIRITGIQGAYLSVWTALLLAAMAGRSSASWQLPPRFRIPIVMWGLAVGLSWPIVALRELDWQPGVLVATPPTHDPAIHAVTTALYVSGIAAAQLVGMLWVDWLYGRFAQRGVRAFERQIVWPLVITATGGAVLAVYQGFVDLEYPRQSLWAFIGRASGPLDDANASAALAAIWAAVPVALTIGARLPRSMIAWSLSGLLLLGMWQTGSRSAVACALIAFTGVLYVTLRRSRRRELIVAVMLGAIAIGTLTAPAFFNASSSNPIARMREFQRAFDAGGLAEVGRELWRRNGYGAAAAVMIREEPVQGVGVGAFPALSGDFTRVTGGALPADNAQNWVRHQVAELGLLGAAGPLWWSALIVLALFAAPIAPGDRDRAAIVKSAIVGFGVISMVGVPSQNLFVAVTVWTMCGWLLLFQSDGDTPARAMSRGRGSLYAGAVVVAVIVAILTYESAWRELRPPFRAKRFDYPYTAGLYTPMDGPVGTTVTAGHAVVVPVARTGLLKLTLWVEHPDANQAPVRVEVWVDNARVVRGRFGRSVPLTRYVNLRRGQRFVLETRVDRTFAAPERLQPEVGLNVTWHFVETSAGEDSPGSVR